MSDKNELEKKTLKETRSGEVFVKTISSSEDEDFNAQKVINLTPEHAHYTDVEDYGELEPTDCNFIYKHPVDVRTYKFLTIYFHKTSSDKDKSILRICALTKWEDENSYIRLSNQTRSQKSYHFKLSKGEIYKFITIDVQGLNYVRFEVAKNTNYGSNPKFHFKISKQ